MIDVGALLEKVEAAAPIDAVEVVAAELGRMVDATAVTLLIADFSGRAVVRLTPPSWCAAPAATASSRPRPCRSRAPGTSRCCARSGPTSRRSATEPECSSRSPTAATRSACWNWTCRGYPSPTRSSTSAAPRMPSPTSSLRPAGTPTSSSGGSARRRSHWPRRSSGACCRRPTPARPASSPSPAGWSRPARWGRHLRLHAGPRMPAGVDHRRRRAPGAAALLATLLVGGLRNGRRAGMDLGEQAATPTTRWPRTPRRASSSPAS